MSCRNEWNSELVPVSLTLDPAATVRRLVIACIVYEPTPLSPDISDGDTIAPPPHRVLTTANARRRRDRVSSPADGGGGAKERERFTFQKHDSRVSKSRSERVWAYYTYNTYYTRARIFIWTHKCAVEFIACTPPAFSRRVPKWIRRLPRDLP